MTRTPPTYHLRPGFDARLESFLDQFLKEGMAYFSEEFGAIDGFLAHALADRSERDDHELRRTPKENYLHALLTVAMLNRQNRQAFNRSKETLIVMPDCLSLHNPSCLKTDEKWGDQCQSCTPTCRAYQVQELADQYGATCLFSKRKLAEQIGHFAGRSENLGVIGIACILMLAEGMRTAADAGLPVRGVLLDFCGCEHWNDEPFASEFDISMLAGILKEKYEH
ncbi:MAG: DUF116 domain-containing protein [Candidatus Zixiibacteriota bacterium]